MKKLTLDEVGEAYDFAHASAVRAAAEAWRHPTDESLYLARTAALDKAVIKGIELMKRWRAERQKAIFAGQ